MQPNTQIIKVPERILTVFEDSESIRQFEAILHTRTNAFIKSALIVIADSNDLMNCTPQSLVGGVLRSATLGLSLDPALRQAYLVPRTVKDALTACFQPHYHGLYDLAVRTNKYRYISVMPIHQGERVLEDPQTGIHYWTNGMSATILSPIKGEGGLRTDNMRDVTSGKNPAPVIGYLGYFKTMKGFEKSVWMTIPEIHKHAQTWSPGGYKSAKGGWQDNRKRPIMEMKTVFIALSKFMDLSGDESRNLKGAIEEDLLNAPEIEETIDAKTEPVYEDVDTPEQTPEPQGAVTELIVESAVPGPQLNRTKPNEIVTDSDWNNFTRLIERANTAGLVTRTYNRAEMTASTIAGVSKYLQQQITKLQPK